MTEKYLDVSENRVVFPQIIPVFLGFSIINHPFLGYPYFLETSISMNHWFKKREVKTLVFLMKCHSEKPHGTKYIPWLKWVERHSEIEVSKSINCYAKGILDTPKAPWRELWLLLLIQSVVCSILFFALNRSPKVSRTYNLRLFLG